MNDSRTWPSPIVPGYHVEVDANAFDDLVTSALDELQRTGRRCDFENLAQYMGVSAAFLRACVAIEAVDANV